MAQAPDFKEVRISQTELMASLSVHLYRIKCDKLVLHVERDSAGAPKEPGFVLVPFEIGTRVLGLIDEEYGWPETVTLASIFSVERIARGTRRHPFIYSDDKTPLAISVSEEEFALIKRKFFKT